MSETILSAEPTIRLAAFLGVLAAMALWEVAAPRRRREIPRAIRWTNNLALVVVDTVIPRPSSPILAVGLAVMAEERSWGLFNNLDTLVWVAIVVSMLLLDLAIYLQHVMFHAVPGLWRLHRMHHADLDFDATTGLRFHPIEILISMGIKLALVAALGPPAVAVLLFEVLLNATALFNHANVDLPRPVDRVLHLCRLAPQHARPDHGWANIPTRANRRDPICFSPCLYKARNLIERFLNNIKHFRRIATHYDKLAENYLAALKLVAVRIWLCHNGSTA